jgi:type III secretory pathway component EscT
VGSGHAAGQLVDKVHGLERSIAQHEGLGIATRNLFTLLTVVWALVMLVPVWRKKPLAPPLRIGVQVAFLACYLVATAVLANTAMQGGQLVHDHGVRAMLGR